MEKYFNIAGPCNSKEHYMVPVLEKIKEIQSLIDYKYYFVIHAARQTGKTTLLHELLNHLESEGRYYALYCSLESIHTFTEAERGIPEIINVIKSAVKYSKLPYRKDFARNVDWNSISTLIGDALKDYCSLLDKPLVVLFDEIDGLQNGTLITFLRQIRDGFITRNRIPFLHSVALVGMRNIRDYKSRVREGRKTLGTGSPFNVITENLILQNFDLLAIKNLYEQHTHTTGQLFNTDAIHKVYEETDGQPWLVNAIAREIVVKILKNDYSKSITPELVEQAIRNIVLRRDTHIDSLLDKLKEERVRKIIEPIIVGKRNVVNFTDDDTIYCINLGLIKLKDGELIPANKIYNEVIIRTLSYNTQMHLITSIQNSWINDDGDLDMFGLLKSFQQFWRENSEIWVGKYDYKEAAPHLILQAFLQRVINSGGSILREYALNRERLDLCVLFNGKKYPIELKLFYTKSVIEQGIIQLTNYMDKLGEKIGWLVIFDRNTEKPWEEKIYWKVEEKDGLVINIVGC